MIVRKAGCPQDGRFTKTSQSFATVRPKKKWKPKTILWYRANILLFVNRDEQIDYDDKMKALQQDITKLLQKEAQSKKDLLECLAELGYAIRYKD